jgi:hypothetical protein
VQPPAFHIFHGQVTGAASFANLIQNGNPRMIQCGHRARLSIEAPNPVLVPSEFRRQHLESDSAPQTSILSQVDHSHTPGPQLRQDLIVRYLLPKHVAETLVRQGMVGRVYRQVNARRTFGTACSLDGSGSTSEAKQLR